MYYAILQQPSHHILFELLQITDALLREIMKLTERSRLLHCKINKLTDTIREKVKMVLPKKS